ncbi:hypothetical protein N431DRAFT_357817 [Stipitochalara longipes BDJ]|nr:hypothetical protein N431DRAFT_357817 [Stipitochalara longipes BDJ]
MTRPHPLFDLSSTYLEVDGWVIIDLNRETGSIHQYEDYELSAESFLIEVKMMPILPSLRMPFPSMASAKELRSREISSDQENKSNTKGGEAGNHTREKANHETVNTAATNKVARPRTYSDVELLSPRQKRERRWAEIRRILTAPLDEDEDEDDAIAKDNIEIKSKTDSLDSADNVNCEVDSPQREGSESPQTDPDFVRSSSDSIDVERILGSRMVGLKVSDSFFIVGSKGTNSMSGEVDVEDKEAVGGIIDDADAVGVEKHHEYESGEKYEVTTNDEDVYGKSEDLEEVSQGQRYNTDRDQKRKDRRNIGLAASATAVMVAAIWMLERKYDLS